MRTVRSYIGLALCVAMLSNCGGGGGSVQSVPALPKGGGANPSAAVTVNIRVPLTKKKSKSQGRKPQYVSSFTQSASVTVGALPPVTVNIGGSTPGCTTNAAMTESVMPGGGSQPTQIAAASDGSVFYADETGGSGHVGQVLAGGAFGPQAYIGDTETSVGADSDGSVWSGHVFGAAYGLENTISGVATYVDYSAKYSNYGGGIALGSDGNVYFSMLDTTANVVPVNYLGRMTGTPGTRAVDLSNWAGISGNATGGISRLKAGIDGSIWFTEDNGMIGHLTVSPLSAIVEYPSGGNGTRDTVMGLDNYGPIGLAVDPHDGSVYFPILATIPSGGGTTLTGLGHLSSSGSPLATIPLPMTPPSGVTNSITGLAVGPDGAIWIADAYGHVGRVTTAGAYTQYPTPLGGIGTPGVGVQDIVTGADNQIYFTERQSNYIGYMTLSYSCSATVLSPPGATTVTIKTYDGPNATGNVLSQTLNSPMTVNANGANVMNFALDGVVDHVNLLGNPANPHLGCGAPYAGSTGISAQAVDVDGSTIIGSGGVVDAAGNPLQILLTVSDTGASDAFSPNSLTWPSDSSSLTLSNSTGNAVVTGISSGAPAATVPHGINSVTITSGSPC